MRLAAHNVNVSYDSGNLDDLRSALQNGVPPIVLVSTKHFSHWQVEAAHAVVVTAMDDEQVLIHDPGIDQGPTMVGLDDFYLAWDEMANLYCLIWKT